SFQAAAALPGGIRRHNQSNKEKRRALRSSPPFRSSPTALTPARNRFMLLIGKRRKALHGHPAPLLPRLHTLLCQLHPFRPFLQIPPERRPRHYMLQKQLPLHLESIVKRLLLRHLLPLLEKIQWILDIRIPHRPRRPPIVLNPAMPQPRHRRAARPIHMERKQVIAPYTRAPR